MPKRKSLNEIYLDLWSHTATGDIPEDLDKAWSVKFGNTISMLLDYVYKDHIADNKSTIARDADTDEVIVVYRKSIFPWGRLKGNLTLRYAANGRVEVVYSGLERVKYYQLPKMYGTDISGAFSINYNESFFSELHVNASVCHAGDGLSKRLDTISFTLRQPSGPFTTKL